MKLKDTKDKHILCILKRREVLKSVEKNLGYNSKTTHKNKQHQQETDLRSMLVPKRLVMLGLFFLSLSGVAVMLDLFDC